MSYIKFLKLTTKDDVQINIPFDKLIKGESIITVVRSGIRIADIFGTQIEYDGNIYSPGIEKCLAYFTIKE